MSWREAFLRQARSENRVRFILNAPGVELSHRLHYLQMVTEKLSKGLLASSKHVDPPFFSHRVFVRFLQTMKQWPEVRRELGYSDAAVFRNFVNSLLDTANRVEQLAPSRAGVNHPNPEYPWRDPETGAIVAPVDFPFALMDPRDVKMMKLEKLIDALVRMAT